MVETQRSELERPDEGAASNRFPTSERNSYVATSVGSIAVLVWRTGTSVAGVRAIERVISQMKRQSPRVPIGFLTVGSPGMDLKIANGVRTELARFLKAYGADIAAAAIAYEGTGFKATIVRSVVTAVSIASHPPFPYRVFANVDPALQWLADHVGGATEEMTTGVRTILRRSGD